MLARRGEQDLSLNDLGFLAARWGSLDKSLLSWRELQTGETRIGGTGI